ncbi:DMT family transporter [Halocynthiibacter namhaensis]|uniref:DMT family transporter n=1 Tax=Halocynthiibacter namhaensis TaxID=1290553 RepID=UPI001EE18252|nr:DMT family transporter [Halocynthiibacter namhaensis]
MLIVMRPGTDGLFTATAFIPLAGALGAGFAVISVRRLSQTESTATLLAYQSVFVGLLSGVPMLWLWQTPSLAGWCLLLAMGGIATLGQWIGVKALRMGEASVIGNVEYVKLIWAAGFGYVLFGEVPDAYALVGAAVIVGAALYMLWREGMRGQA